MEMAGATFFLLARQRADNAILKKDVMILPWIVLWSFGLSVTCIDRFRDKIASATAVFAITNWSGHVDVIDSRR